VRRGDPRCGAPLRVSALVLDASNSAVASTTPLGSVAAAVAAGRDEDEDGEEAGVEAITDDGGTSAADGDENGDKAGAVEDIVDGGGDGRRGDPRCAAPLRVSAPVIDSSNSAVASTIPLDSAAAAAAAGCDEDEDEDEAVGSAAAGTLLRTTAADEDEDGEEAGAVEDIVDGGGTSATGDGDEGHEEMSGPPCVASAADVGVLSRDGVGQQGSKHTPFSSS